MNYLSQNFTDSEQSVEESLKKDWNNATTTEVLRLIKENAQNELDTVEKAMKKKGGMLSKASDGDGGNIESLEHLRWFVLPRDIKSTDFKSDITTTISGPIQPNQSLDQISQSKNVSTIELTAYAKVRDEKFKKHDGKDVTLPRYITLFSDKSDEQSLLEILRNNLMNILQSQVSTKDVSANKTQLTTKEKLQQPSQNSAITKQTEQPFPECSTGSCFLPPRNGKDPLLFHLMFSLEYRDSYTFSLK